MLTTLQEYNAVKLRDEMAGVNRRSDSEIVLNYIETLPTKREEIVGKFATSQNVSMPVAIEVVAETIRKLLKEKKIQRVRTGYYILA